MIDRIELIIWTFEIERQVYHTSHSEETKKVHRDYMELFRAHVMNMPDVKPKDRLLLGFEIGLWTELIIFLIIFKLTGTI